MWFESAWSRHFFEDKSLKVISQGKIAWYANTHIPKEYIFSMCQLILTSFPLRSVHHAISLRMHFFCSFFFYFFFIFFVDATISCYWLISRATHTQLTASVCYYLLPLAWFHCVCVCVCLYADGLLRLDNEEYDEKLHFVCVCSCAIDWLPLCILV